MTILLVDDHMLFRDAVADVLGRQYGLRIIRCGSVQEAARTLVREPVNVALVDYDLGHETAFQFLSEMRKLQRSVPVLIVTAGLAMPQARRLLEEGVAGIFMKDQSLESMVAATRGVAAGQSYLDPRYFAATQPADTDGDDAMRLSPREHQTLQAILEGRSNKQIAVRLGVSESTVKGIIQKLFEKTGVRTRSQLVRVALEQLGAD
jgi:DNA-binding NarL/FixJ family response regulator